MEKLGLIVNPIAGMGGRVGLKGTDGEKTLERARKLGASPVSPDRALVALQRCRPLKDDIKLITYPGPMGEREARAVGFNPSVIGEVDSERTTAHDTKRAARDLLEEIVDLLLFAGGDGTARDIYDAINGDLTVLGIPTGVKIHSSVYAVNPASAGELAVKYLSGAGSVDIRQGEVMDIDEEAFRENRVSARLYGYLNVPYEQQLIQNPKSGRGTSESVEDCAHSVVDNLERDCIYLLGPGTTTRPIMERLGLENTLLGIDAVMNGQLLGSDLNEARILDLIGEHPGIPARIIVSVVGGQGYIFGRGNQQFSPTVIKRVGRDNVIVVASEEKIAALNARPLRVDTGDSEVDDLLSGYIRVTTGYGKQIVYEVRS